MTLCIAAIAKDALIGLSDTRITYGKVGISRDMAKLLRIGSKNMFALLAGELTLCSELVVVMSARLHELSEDNQTVRKASYLLCDARNERFSNEYKSQGNWEGSRNEIYNQAIDIIIAGVDRVDGVDVSSIYTIDNKCEPKHCTNNGSECSGTGMEIGNRFLKGYKKSQSSAEVIARVYCAKQRTAGFLSDVDYGTSMVVIKDSKYRAFTDDEALMNELDKAYKEIEASEQSILTKDRPAIADCFSKE